MWYVIQVAGGTEHKVKGDLERYLPEGLMEKCFIPLYEEKVKFNHNWHMKTKILFPCYLFVVTDDPEKLYMELKHIDGLTKLLKSGDDILPLPENEVDLLKRLGGDNHIVEMSLGYKEGDKVVITKGPLIGYETLIKKIDRHKRKAILEVEFFHQKKEIEVGLEVLPSVQNDK